MTNGNRDSIKKYYIAIKYYSEGMGYTSKLILDILNNTQNKDQYRRIIFVVYRELFLPLLISVMACHSKGKRQFKLEINLVLCHSLMQ